MSDKVEKQVDGKLVGKGFDPQKLMSFTHNEKFSFPRNAASWM